MRGVFCVQVQKAEGETLSEGATSRSVEPTLACRTGKQGITGLGTETRFVLKTLHFSIAAIKMTTAATAVMEAASYNIAAEDMSYICRIILASQPYPAPISQFFAAKSFADKCTQTCPYIHLSCANPSTGNVFHTSHIA